MLSPLPSLVSLPSLPSLPSLVSLGQAAPPGVTRLGRAAALVATVALLAGGCGGGGGGGAPAAGRRNPTTTTSPPSTAAPGSTDESGAGGSSTSAPDETPADPAKAPRTDADVTPAYVQAVLDGLMGRYQQAYVTARSSGQLGEAFVAQLQSIFTPAAAQREEAGFVRFGGVAVIADPPGRPVARLRQVLAGGPRCISVSADIRLGPLVTKAFSPTQPYWVRLDRADDARLPWRIAYIGFGAENRPKASCSA
ncbi:MAG: hypothetical protein HYX34_02320 [Actinobacteria bacterium]|nr:hypothetical protein [Actinomycetota bacterium]